MTPKAPYKIYRRGTRTWFLTHDSSGYVSWHTSQSQAIDAMFRHYQYWATRDAFRVEEIDDGVGEWHTCIRCGYTSQSVQESWYQVEGGIRFCTICADAWLDFWGDEPPLLPLD